MGEPLAMNVSKRLQDGLEHLAGFRCGQGAVAERGGEILFGVLHDNICHRVVIDAGSSRPRQADVVRMRELRGTLPPGEEFPGGDRETEFDGCLARFRFVDLGEKNRAIRVASQQAKQRKTPVDDLAFPLFPRTSVIIRKPPFMKGRTHCTEALGKTTVEAGWSRAGSILELNGLNRTAAFPELAERVKIHAYSLRTVAISTKNIFDSLLYLPDVSVLIAAPAVWCLNHLYTIAYDT